MLKAWEEVHNCYRPHQALGYKTPKAFYLQPTTLERISGVRHVPNEYRGLTPSRCWCYPGFG